MDLKEAFKIRKKDAESDDVIITIGNHLATEQVFKSEEEAQKVIGATDWNQGLLDAGSAANALYVPWVTPFKSKKFCERWKVLKVTKRVLSSGAVHTHFYGNCFWRRFFAYSCLYSWPQALSI